MIKVERVDGFEIRTEYRLCFSDKAGGGYSFACDPQGNVDESELHHSAAENYQRCINGFHDVTLEGVEEFVTTLRLCSCGSGEYPEEQYDARGIYLTSTCYQCEEERLGRFRPEVLTDSNYHTDEPIDEPD